MFPIKFRAPSVTVKISFVLMSISVAIISSLDQLCVSNCLIETTQATGGRNFFPRAPHFGQPCFKVPCCPVHKE